MQSEPGVIDHLNVVLKDHLTSDQPDLPTRTYAA